MSESLHEEEQPSPLAPLFTPEEWDELSELMLSFDGGVIDFGELDGFLSALAVAPQAGTLERWWTALFGPEPEWEAEHEPVRARALVERYYAMVQARVALDPRELGPACLPPLQGWPGADADDEGRSWDEVLAEVEDEDFYAEDDDVGDLASPTHHARVIPEAYGGATGLPVGEDDEYADELAASGDWQPAEDDEEDAAFESDAEDDVEFAFAETWLCGFRYALSLQADEWRRVVDAEPALALWLYPLWITADDPDSERSRDELTAMAPTPAPPEDAGFLALEATLRQHALALAPADVARVDDDGLIVQIPHLLHQLWRKHRAQAGPVAETIAELCREGLLGLRDGDEDELNELLVKHALPGMQLEYLDGRWSALIAAGEEIDPLDGLDRIFGAGKVWEDHEEARELIHALLHHVENVRKRIARVVDLDDPMCAPFIDYPPGEDPSKHPGRPFGTRFALGFLAGIEELPRSARLLLMDPEAKHWLAPFEALARSQSLEHKGKALRPAERAALVSELPQCIAELGRFWVSEGERTPAPAPARAEPLPGRNDPCPCGSGKKYKKCHGAPERLH